LILEEAVIAALAAGAEIENPESHPMRLRWSGSWLTTLSAAAMLEIVSADPGRLDQALSWWQGHLDYMARYRRALAAGDEKNKAWWRRRFLEDYNYTGPFPDDPPMPDDAKSHGLTDPDLAG